MHLEKGIVFWAGRWDYLRSLIRLAETYRSDAIG